MLTYKKGNLFNAPLNSVVVHSCNCKGSWGAGIALDFKKKFPMTYLCYKSLCKTYYKNLLGTCLISYENGYHVACLFTSSGFGSEVDSPDDILTNTGKAISDLMDQLPADIAYRTICMPKINAGLFKVPWESTERLLTRFHQNFTVYEL